MKTCTKCKAKKHLIDFPVGKNIKDGRDSWCRLCKNKQTKILREKYRDSGFCSVGCGKILFNKTLCKEHSVKKNELAKRLKRKQRITAIEHYGNKCVCCGERGLRFLTFEHKNGDGAKHRKETGTGGGSNFARWLIKNNFPKSIEILCYNCNCARGFYGYCHSRI